MKTLQTMKALGFAYENQPNVSKDSGDFFPGQFDLF
jgi:hypothetical protein